MKNLIVYNEKKFPYFPRSFPLLLGSDSNEMRPIVVVDHAINEGEI